MKLIDKILQSRFFLTLISILISFAFGALFLLVMGISPLVAYGKLLDGVFSTTKNLSYCVVYATPLVFTGLAVACSTSVRRVSSSWAPWRPAWWAFWCPRPATC